MLTFWHKIFFEGSDDHPWKKGSRNHACCPNPLQIWWRMQHKRASCIVETLTETRQIVGLWKPSRGLAFMAARRRSSEVEPADARAWLTGNSFFLRQIMAASYYWVWHAVASPFRLLSGHATSKFVNPRGNKLKIAGIKSQNLQKHIEWLEFGSGHLIHFLP